MKKKTITRVLLILILVVPVTFQFSSILSFNNVTQFDPNRDVDEEKEGIDNILAPLISAPEFVNISKNIVKGFQGAGNETNLKYDDGVYDSTIFGLGIPWPNKKEYADTIGINSGLWGFDSGDITTALKDDDANELYVQTQTLGGDIYLRWKGYQNFSAVVHPHVFRININFEVRVEGVIGSGLSDLIIYAMDDKNNREEYLIDSSPDINGETYFKINNWIINSGDLLDNVKAGGYITKMGVEMSSPTAFSTIWIDWVDIFYWTQLYSVDFSYELDFGGYDLTTITEFDVVIDFIEIVPLLNIYLYNYELTKWDKVIPNILTIGEHNKTISVNADDYFDSLKKLKIRFDRGLYQDIRSPWAYQIKIDLIQIDLKPPDKPFNVDVNQGINHVLLSWDTPIDNGAPIIDYNVYRGEIAGGSKTFIGNSAINEFNDTTGVVGTLYYYIIRAENMIGESENSTEVSGKSYDQPFIEWINPYEGATVVLPFNKSDDAGNWLNFNFTYDWAELDNVILEIGNGSGTTNYTNIGWGTTSVRPYPYVNGSITATLYGYNNSILLSTDTIHFTFVRVIHEVRERLDFGTKTLGQQLYLILHDPHGDNSYTSFKETTTLSIGIGHAITTAEASHLSVGVDFSLFGIDIGASAKTTTTETEEEGFDFRFEVSDITTFTSNQESDNPDYIGPGYGDAYWGESWNFKWELNATYRGYSNGTYQHESPKFWYGIIRMAETLINDLNAPANWRNQNPTHNGGTGAEWIDTLNNYGGLPYENTHIVTNTVGRSKSFEVEIEESVAASIGIDWFSIGGSLTFTETVKNYVEVGLAHTIETSYRIHDDDPTDHIIQELGIDTKFGTYIFSSYPFACETSLPLEHNTYDYLPPILAFPVIDLDTDNDMIAPTTADSPYVTVDIFEEGGVQSAIINYSIDNGLNWGVINLQEQLANPGTWAASIPTQSVNTKVKWYIMAWDDAGGRSIRMNATGDPFSYTVLPLPIEDAAIPGYSAVSIISITIIAVVAITIIHYRKHLKYKK